MELISIKEACQVFKVSRNTILAWRRAGMPHYQPIPRGRVLIDKDEVFAWLKTLKPEYALLQKIKRMKKF